MPRTQKIQITFGELIEAVYKTAEQFPDVAPCRIAAEVSSWTASGRVQFKNPAAVQHLLREID